MEHTKFEKKTKKCLKEAKLQARALALRKNLQKRKQQMRLREKAELIILDSDIEPKKIESS